MYELKFVLLIRLFTGNDKKIRRLSYYISSRALLFTAFILFSGILKGQYKEYSLNSPGSKCYFRYMSYAADSNYANLKRPLILIMGEENTTALDVYNRDTLRNSFEFSNYMFVYLPGSDIASDRKLDCVEALVSLLTYNYKYGKGNLFFQVNDTVIDRIAINESGLNSVFKGIRLKQEEAYFAANGSKSAAIAEEFRESVLDYAPQEGEAEDLAKYYIEETADENNEEDLFSFIPQKTYFGPPETLNYTLTGIVHDKASGEALPFAGVQVKGTTIGVSTNADGYFTLLKVPSDTSTLIVQYLGYEKTPVFLTPQSPKKNLNIEIRQQSHALKEVKVTANKDDVVFVKRAEVSTIKFTPVKMEQLPSIGEKDIMRSFQLMPGISASNESSSGLYVRGGTPDQNLVLYDGFTVYHVDHLYGFFSAFNSNALKDIQLFKGGFESRFGGRISSVTEITSKEGNQKRINVGADISLLSTNIFAEIPVGDKFSSFIAFRKSYQGTMYNMIFKKFNKSRTQNAPDVGTGSGQRFSQSTQITSYFYDLNGRFTYRSTDKDIISLSIFNGTDKLDNSFSSDIPSFGQFNSNFSMNSVDLTKYGNIGSSLKWSRKWNSKLYGNTILSYSNYYNKRDRSSERTLIRPDDETTTNMSGIFEDNDLKDYSMKSDFQWDLTDFSQIQFGGFSTYYNIKYSYAQSDTANILDRDGQAFLNGLYIQSRTKLLKDKIQILPGIRTDYFQTTGKLYFEPRASVTFNITDRLILKGSTGKFYQFANRVTREDIMSGSKEFWILSDGTSVPISSSVHYIAGLSYESDNYTFSAEGYYKKISNLTEYSLRINASPMGVDYNENFFNGYGYSKGLELLAQKNTGNLNGWISYTLGEAKNHFDEYSDSYYSANQDVTHEFKIVGLYKFRRWDFSATWIYATGRPYTAPSGAYSITLLDGTSKDFFTMTSKNGVRLPDYHRLDLSATYKLLMGRRGDRKRRELGNISVSLFNVYNRKNVWYKQFIIEEGEIIETNINYLGITPNVTLSLKLR
jgi:ferric enterobactin receptor